jgi:hypothetical protein
MHLVMGSLYSLGLLSPFMMSLINKSHPDVSLDDGFFLIPLAILAMCLTMTLSGKVEKAYGPRV